MPEFPTRPDVDVAIDILDIDIDRRPDVPTPRPVAMVLTISSLFAL